MNCGLGNLDTLKRHLLPAGTMAGEARFDAVITDLGQGVADEFENVCNRKFCRLVGATITFQADRASFVLPRFPVEAIAAVELESNGADGFVAEELTLIQSSSPESGLVYLPERPDAGKYWGHIRFTYTGGYWFEVLEPDDEGYPSTMPATATALPNGLRLAWLNHCRQVWNVWDKLGLGLVDKPSVQTIIGELDYSPAVKRTLGNYTVMQPI